MVDISTPGTKRSKIRIRLDDLNAYLTRPATETA